MQGGQRVDGTKLGPAGPATVTPVNPSPPYYQWHGAWRLMADAWCVAPHTYYTTCNTCTCAGGPHRQPGSWQSPSCRRVCIYFGSWSVSFTVALGSKQVQLHCKNMSQKQTERQVQVCVPHTPSHRPFRPELARADPCYADHGMVWYGMVWYGIARKPYQRKTK